MNTMKTEKKQGVILIILIMKFMLGENGREDRRNTRLSALLGSKDCWHWSPRESESLEL